MFAISTTERSAGARALRAGLTLSLLLALALLSTGCFSWMERTELKIDQIGKEQRKLQGSQDELAGEVAHIRALLESEGMVSDERRAELLTRLRTLELTIERMDARAQEQEAMLRRMSASLDQLTRQSWRPQNPAVGAQLPADAAPVADVDSLYVDESRDEAVTTAPADADSLYLYGEGPDTLGSMMPDDGGSTELVVYDAAMRDFSSGDYALARFGFEELLTRFPRSELADNSAYWIAESHYAEGNFAEALPRFQGVERAFPDSDVLSAAMLKSGYCQLELGDEDGAVRTFRQLVIQDPESDEAEIAAHKLRSLGRAR